MIRRTSALSLALALIITWVLPTAVQAAYTPPTVFGAPESLSVQVREDGTDNSWQGFDATVSASPELRAFVDEVGADSSPFTAAGFYLSDIMLQLDYKVDNGPWHYSSQWDQDFGYNTNKSLIRIEKGTYANAAVFDKAQFESMSSGEALPAERSYFDTHSMTFRARFLVSYQDALGNTLAYFSPWSATTTYRNKQEVLDPAALITHVPVLKAAELKKLPDGKPYLSITADKAHEDLLTLNSISGNHVKTEVWLKVGQGEWRLAHTGGFNEEFDVAGMEAYFGLQEQYGAAVYEIRFRYSFDYNYYPAAGKSGVIYSPFSNVISHGMAAYSNASDWAKTELDKANAYGLLPDSLRGADMTRPITREEFAEVAVLLYEKATGTASVPFAPNPFKDTANPQVLKAFGLEIVKGTTATTFDPKELTNREQVATMLSRTIRAIAPKGDFSTSGAPTFGDQRDISDWALEHVLYMAKLGIIKGSDGNFMPKAVTSAQVATGYATTTREQAVAMSVRSFEKMDTIKAAQLQASSEGLVGMWSYSASSGNVGLFVGLELKSDGTFVKLLGTSTSFSVSGTSFKGNYRVSGNTILFYNRLKGTAQGSDLQDMLFNPSIDDVPVADDQQAFVLKDSGTLILGETEFKRAH